jgi:hypothetical protein
MTDTFRLAKSAAHRIEGMLSDFSIASMDAVLSFQEECGTRGHLVEFGVFRAGPRPSRQATRDRQNV